MFGEFGNLVSASYQKYMFLFTFVIQNPMKKGEKMQLKLFPQNQLQIFYITDFHIYKISCRFSHSHLLLYNSSKKIILIKIYSHLINIETLKFQLFDSCIYYFKITFPVNKSNICCRTLQKIQQRKMKSKPQIITVKVLVYISFWSLSLHPSVQLYLFYNWD